MTLAETRLPLPLPADIYIQGLLGKREQLGAVCTGEEILAHALLRVVAVKGLEHVLQTVAAFLEITAPGANSPERRLSQTVVPIFIIMLGKEVSLEAAYRDVETTLLTLAAGSEPLQALLLQEAELGYRQLQAILEPA